MAEYLEKSMCVRLINDPRLFCSEALERAILCAPSADVAPVVHGRWLGYECSVCGVSSEYGSSNYCPNCGAKMDGGDGNG